MASASVKINANSSEFQASMRAMTNSLKEVDSSLNLASEQARLFGSSSDALSSQVDLLSSRLEGQTAILGEQKEYITVLSEDQLKLAEAQKACEVSLADLNNERKEALSEYGAESSEVEALDATILELNVEYRALGTSLDRTNAKMATATIKANNMETSMLRTTASLNEANLAFKTRHIDAFSSSMGKVSSVSGNVSRSLRPLSFGLLAIGGYAGYASVKFGTALAKLSTIADTSKVSMGTFRSSILALSNQTGVSATEISESAYQAISASVNTGDAMHFVSQATELAEAGFTDTGHSVDVLTTILNAYGLKASDVGRISNDLIRTQNLGKTTVNELSSSMGAVIPIAAATGVNLQQLSTAFVLLTKQGINTATAGTDIKGMLNELGKSGSKSDLILRKLTGQGFKGLITSGKTVGDVLQMLKIHAEKSGKGLNDMFGNIRGGTAAMDLVKVSSKTFNDTLETMNKTGNDTNIAFKKISETAGFKLHKSLIQLQNAAIKLGGALTPIIAHISSGLSKIATSISSLSPKQLKLITDIGIGIITFTLFTGILSKVTGGLGLLGKGLSRSVKFFTKTDHVVGGVTKSYSQFGKVLGGIKSVASKAGETMKLLWGIMMANPIILIVAGLVALGVAFYEAYKHCKVFRDGVNEAFSIIIKAFKTCITFLSSIFGPIWQSIMSSLKVAIKVFSEVVTSIWSVITTIFKGFMSFLSSVFKPLWSTLITNLKEPLSKFGIAVSSVWTTIKYIFTTFSSFLSGVFKPMWSAEIGVLKFLIKGFAIVIGAIWKGIEFVFKGFIDFFSGMFKSNFEETTGAVSVIIKALKPIFDIVFNGIKQVLSVFIGFLKGNFVATFKFAFSLIGTIIKGFLGIATGIIHMITGVFRGLTDFIVGVFTGNWSQAWNGIKEIFSSVFNGMKEICSSVWNSIISIIQGAVNFISSIISGIFSAFNKVTSIASNIGHKVASVIGLHVVLPNIDINKNSNLNVNHRAIPMSFASMPKTLSNMKNKTTSFASIGSLNNNLNSLSELSSIASNSNLNNISNSGNKNNIDINSIIDKVATEIGEKVHEAFKNNNTDKEINLKVILNGKEIAYASNDYQNRMNGKEIELQKRLRGL
ncbi:phage tail tape measure protein [uncultured Clostridium sp.]|uniref:phage tail tape measure protein n=1 Tax=uncultured Clostridium sp. TaxID=59620 RepID=UPI002635A8FF|nr:phage tail tape measure protein [uncultured Clostridium sp.]